MATTDPRVDAYMARSAPFAKPILSYIRKAVHAGCPAVEETTKCAFGFWKRSLLGQDGAAAKSSEALAAFNAFSASHKREYIEWVTEAKSDETRQRRMVTAIGWLSDGKSRNWKYERKGGAA